MRSVVIQMAAPRRIRGQKESTMALTLAEANQIVQAAITRAKEMNIKISVAL